MPDKILASTRFLNFVERAGWCFVSRTSGQDVACIIPILQEGVGARRYLILIEQFRLPIGKRVIELPAGLVGDNKAEPIEEAANRELLEETGYQAGTMKQVSRCAASAGLTDEMLNFFVARDLVRIGDGGGVAEENENIQVHRVPLYDAPFWLQQQLAEREVIVSANVYAGIFFAMAAVSNT